MAVSLVAIIIVGCVVGGGICLALAVVSWRHRDVPAALPFGGLILAVAAWAFGEAAFLLADTTTTAFVADRVMRAAASQVPVLWVLFVLAFAGYERWINWRTIAALWAVPTAYVAVMVMAPILDISSLPRTAVFVTKGTIREPYVGTGIYHELFLVFGYLTMAIGFVILGAFLIRSRAVYRKQAAILVLGPLAPIAANVALQMGFTPHPGIDLTPMAFALSGLLFGWSLVKYDFLTVTPMAGDVLVDELPDPVFVLDEADRIVDLNPAASAAFGLSYPHGEPIDAIDPALPTDVTDGTAIRLAHDERTDEPGETYFECSVTRLEDQYGEERNRLVVLRDVTGQQRRQQRLEALQEATRKFLAASTDEEIAEIGVEYADMVLDSHGTAVFLTEDDADGFVSVARTDTVADVFERGEHPPGPIADVLATAYDEEELAALDLPDAVGGMADRGLAVPLGDHGVLWIGTRVADVIEPDDEGFATILARTTQVALTRVERESDLRNSRSSVERRSEQIAFFNGVLRHRLRNALLVIQGRADHLRESVPADSHHHIDTIEDWCDDLSELSEEIRAVNDTVTATESERLEVVDLSQTIIECVGTFERDHPAATFELDVDPGLNVLANDLAARVIDGVVENAIIHHDREDPYVTVRTIRAADRVQVHVADDGPGMDDEMKSTVFERDLTTSETASGFGIYFVSVLMNLYGGTVYFEDNHPRGTVAVLEFQCAEDEGDHEVIEDEISDASVEDVDAESD